MEEEIEGENNFWSIDDGIELGNMPIYDDNFTPEGSQYILANLPNQNQNNDIFLKEIPDQRLLTPLADLEKLEKGYPRAINIMTHSFLTLSLFTAMIPQGAAAWIESLNIPAIKNGATVIGIGSHLGKFFLLLYFSTKRFDPNEKEPSAWESVSLAIVNSKENIKHYLNSDWTESTFKFTSLISLAPAATFGMLSFVALSSFAKAVEDNHFGGAFKWLAIVAQKNSVQWICFSTAALGNLISAPGIQKGIFYTVKNIIKDGKKVFNNTQNDPEIESKKSYITGLIASTGLTAITTAGLINFYPLTKNMLKEYAKFSDTTAIPIAAVQTAFICGLGMMNAVEIGRGATQWAFDWIPKIISGNYQKPSSTDVKEVIAEVFVLGLTLAVVTAGGLPNVFQAALEGEGTTLAITAAAASALIELGGTRACIKKGGELAYSAGKWFYDGAKKLKSHCSSSFFSSPAKKDDYNININDNDTNPDEDSKLLSSNSNSKNSTLF